MQQARQKALRKCLWVAFWVLLCSSDIYAQGIPGTGAVLDMEVYAEVPRSPPLTRGNYQGLPVRHSLENFTPTPGDQGDQGSCVGWAVAYAARTMTEARVHEISPRQAVDRHVFSPAYIYNQIAIDGCDSGSMIHHALNLMEREGVMLLRDFPYDANTCTQPIHPHQRSQAANYRIAGWRALTSPGARATHVPTRRALAADRPVVIGMLLPDSFMDSRAIRANNGRWIPSAIDYQTLELRPDALYGHAMTVVGYDDQRFGGAFRIINSWGTDWGDDGYTWVSYDDYSRFVVQAYEIIPIEPELPAVPNLGGSLRFMHIDGHRMTAMQTDRLTWRMNQAYPSGTRFRVELDSDHSGYVYVMGGDLTGRYVEIFPRTHKTSALLVQGETLVMPGPTEDFYTRMDDTLGVDYYVVLFSREPLDIASILAQVNASSGGPQVRLAAALGKRLVEPDVLTHAAGGIGAEGYLLDGAVLPMIVEIEHVGSSAVYQDHNPPRIVVHSPAADIFEEVASGQRIYRVDARRFQVQGVAQDESAIQALQVSGSLQSRYSSRGPFEATLEFPAGEQVMDVEVRATDAAGNTASQIIRIVLDDA